MPTQPLNRIACGLLLAGTLSCVCTTDALGKEPQVESLWTRKGVDWAQFLGPSRNGKSPEKGLAPDWKQQPPKLLYQLEVGEGYSPPTVSQGRLLHHDRVDEVGRIRCFHAESGRLLWQHTYPTDYKDHYGYDGGPRCSPQVDGARVYAMDAAGLLLCLSLQDGKVLWSVDTQKRFGVVQNFFGAGSNPVVFEELLIVMVGGSPEEDQDLLPSELRKARGNGSGIVAFNKHSGKQVYSVTNELASYASLQLANIDGKPWCFAFARSGLLAFDPRTGRQHFHFPWRAKILESVNASTPIVINNEVLISETYGPGAALLRVREGKEPEVVWRDELRSRDKSLQTHWNTPVVHEGYIYACSGRHTPNAELRCVEWKTGKVLWSRRGLDRTSLTYLDGFLLCQGEYGDLLALKASPEAFTPVALLPPPVDDLGRPRLKYPCWAAPVVSHGLMWIRGEGQVLCYDLQLKPQ